MAPKAKQADVKKKAVEDKTFGMKNKNKSKQVQNYVKQLESAMVPSQKQKRAAEAAAGKSKKEKEEEKKNMLNELFAVAIKQPKLPAGVDPKSVVCEFFRHGQCTKGFKCKYSHDLNVEKKGPKIDLFTDQRDVDKVDEEGMEDWDQETLERVVKEKHDREKLSNATTIICKHFLDAVERKQYGWFWKCPGGTECKYRHALPPGYVLKSQMKELLEEEAANRKDVAEEIEEERAQVDAKTPINNEVFNAWHSKRMADKRRKREEKADERRRKGVLTGREIFMQEGFQATDDAGAADTEDRTEGRAEEDRLIQAMLDKASADARTARAAQLAAKAAEDAGEPSAPAAAAAAAAAAEAEASAAAVAPLGFGRAEGGAAVEAERADGVAASLGAGDGDEEFGGDGKDDDEEELFGGDEDDDLDEDELAALEADMRAKAGVEE